MSAKIYAKTSVDDIDWNEVWISQHLPDRQNPAECSNRWNDAGRCNQFNDYARENNFAHGKDRISRLPITKDSNVLDIGAGPGTMTVPLSKMVRHVTAVEPSKYMAQHMRNNLFEIGAENVDIIEKAWEDVAVDSLNSSYDVVFASYSLGFLNLADGLIKMNELSSRYVYLFWFADMRSQWKVRFHDIWSELFNEKLSDGYPVNVIYNLLHQMGYYPNIQIVKQRSPYTYESIDAAVKDNADGLMLKTEKQYEILREFLKERMIKRNNNYILENTSRQAIIWWDKEISF